MAETENKENPKDTGSGGTPPPAAKSGKGDEKSVTEVLREMQAKHDAEIAALRAELDAEKTSHAKDVRDILLGAKKRQESEEERADKYAKAAARIAKRLGGITKKELNGNGN